MTLATQWPGTLVPVADCDQTLPSWEPCVGAAGPCWHRCSPAWAVLTGRCASCAQVLLVRLFLCLTSFS